MINMEHRLSDHILKALKLAIKQGDISIAEHLNTALEESLTRGAGGKDFVEQRDFTQDLKATLQALHNLRLTS